jgi:predicted nucleotide-binding protein
MKSEKHEYSNAVFPAEVLKKASGVFDRQINGDGKLEVSLHMSVNVDGARRGHDDEEEFFADYRKQQTDVYYSRSYGSRSLTVSVDAIYPITDTSVVVQADTWPQILAVMDVFESNKQQALLPDHTEQEEEAEEPIIFLGHGTSPVWKELRDHLRDKQSLQIEAYDIGARAGHTIRDILEAMLDQSSIAFLLMTADDKTVTGELHPRLNVVHEAGLFQGRLGFHRAIVILENGVTEFSNIHGVEQLRFTNIREIFGDVMATIRREFPNL